MGDVVAADEAGVAQYLTPTPCHGRAEESDLGLKHMSQEQVFGVI